MGDCQALQTLTDNNTISHGAQCTPTLALNTIQSVIKEDVHFWHYHNEILFDLCKLPDERIHSLSTRINFLVAKCRFSSEEIKETIKIMLLQHAVKCHKARDWIRLQDQRTLSYQYPLAHCKQLEACCKQFKQAQSQGRAYLTSVTLASAN